MSDLLRRSAALVLAVLLIEGCAQEPAAPTIAEASDHPYVDDLPLPVGFKLVPRQSEDRVSAGFRTVRHMYQGKDSLQAVKNFYQHHMPQSNWEPVEHSLNKGVYSLKYRKGRESCEVRIERMPSGIFGAVTQIRATIQSSGAEAPAKGPVEQR